MARLSYVVLVQKSLSVQNRREHSMLCPIHRQNPNIWIYKPTSDASQTVPYHTTGSKQVNPDTQSIQIRLRNHQEWRLLGLRRRANICTS